MKKADILKLVLTPEGNPLQLPVWHDSRPYEKQGLFMAEMEQKSSALAQKLREINLHKLNKQYAQNGVKKRFFALDNKIKNKKSLALMNEFCSIVEELPPVIFLPVIFDEVIDHKAPHNIELDTIIRYERQLIEASSVSAYEEVLNNIFKLYRRYEAIKEPLQLALKEAHDNNELNFNHNGKPQKYSLATWQDYFTIDYSNASVLEYWNNCLQENENYFTSCPCIYQESKLENSLKHLLKNNNPYLLVQLNERTQEVFILGQEHNNYFLTQDIKEKGVLSFQGIRQATQETRKAMLKLEGLVFLAFYEKGLLQNLKEMTYAATSNSSNSFNADSDMLKHINITLEKVKIDYVLNNETKQSTPALEAVGGIKTAKFKI